LSLFSFLIGIGATIALLRIAFVTEENQRIKWLLFGLLILGGALLGARLGFVLTHTHYYSTRQAAILIFASGGLWWPGALAGGLIFLLGLGLLKPRAIKLLLDTYSVMLLPLGICFWLASWSVGLAYGARVDSSVWWGMPMLDISRVIEPRVPVQPVAALTLLLLLGGIEWLWKKPTAPGRRMSILFLAISMHAFLFSIMRADPIQKWLGLRLDAWAALFFILIGMLLFGLTFDVKSKKTIMLKDKEGK
jgi:prolipoprotein diacylglyceryltransferase